ncbi:MAG TPA: hypothetical protein VGB98_02700 [Pyrinomonadaceae bacterium]
MINQLWVTLALVAALALGSSVGGGTTTNQTSKGINPVQHSE